MIYGADKRLDDVRGEPILALVLYMLREIDRSMNAEQRAATINGMLPLFMKKTEKTPGSGAFGRGAVKKQSIDVPQPDGSSKATNFARGLPGTVMDELAYGEEPISFNTQRPNINFGKFEEIIINTVSWSLELPPEIARLLFTNSFSASRQANNEFNVYLQYRSIVFGNEFYQPIYKERLISAVQVGDLKAPGLIEAHRNKRDWRIVGAWCSATWEGIARPSVDIKKDVDAAVAGLKAGIGTYKFWNKRITGQNYEDVFRQRSKEDKLMQALGLSFTAEEDNNGVSVNAPVPLPEDAQNTLDEFDERINTLESEKNDE